MNFFGLGIPELIFIIVLTLLVLGPERLPAASRQVARLIARARTLFLGSPEAVQATQMALELRREIDQELEQLRHSLADIQRARNEMLRAGQSASSALDSGLAQIQNQFTRAPDVARAVPQQPTVADPPPAGAPEPPPVAPRRARSPFSQDADMNDPHSYTSLDELQALPATYQPPVPPDQPEPTIRPPDAPPILPHAGQAELAARIDLLLHDLAALHEELRRRGLIGPDWQLPSAVVTSFPVERP